MFMDLLRGKGHEVTVEQNLSEIESVKRAIAEAEARIATDESSLAAFEAERLANRYRKGVLQEAVSDTGIEDRRAATERRLSQMTQDLRHQRAYLTQLERPLLESQRREALAEYEAHIVGLKAVARAEAEALVAYMETRGRALAFERETRRLAKVVDRLSRQLGEPDVVIALAPLGSRFRRPSVMSGDENRPSVYQADADRLRAVLDAGEAEIRRAQETPSNDRTGAQADTVFFWGPGGEREQAKKAKATGSARIAAQREAGLPV